MKAGSGPDEAGNRYAAFLRGINVGGRRVTGQQLCAPFETLGFQEVTSFLASGNVTFATASTRGTASTEDLELRIEAALQGALGFEVDVFVRTAAAVADIAGCQPFPPDVVAATGGKLQVTFLRDAPDPTGVAEAMTHATDQDRVTVVGREWYWLPTAGISTSTLDIKAIERALGRGTTRTLNTVTRLQAKLLPDPPS
jgi:uncharacterized protein (DUF1697 family)